MLLTRHARTMYLLRAHSLCPLPVPTTPCGRMAAALPHRPTSPSHDLTILRSHYLTVLLSHYLATSLSYYLTISLPHYLTISRSHHLIQVGWLLLSLTDPMGPPGPVLEAVLSAGGEVSRQY